MQRRHGLDVPTTLADVARADRLALLVYDMQAAILPQIQDGPRVLARVLDVLAAARAAGVWTVFARHVTLPTELMGASQLRMWRAWQRREHVEDVVAPFPPTAEGSQLVPELVPLPSEAVFEKVGMSAFEGTWLDTVLRDCGIGAVAVVGVALEVGIEPTLRHAADLGYVPVLIEDAVGCGDAAAGERSLAAIRFAGDAMLTTSAEFAAALGASG